MMSTLAKILVPALMTVAASTSFATELPPTNSVKIKKITAIGSGCKTSDTYSTNISEDGLAFTITFSEFAAQLGDGISILENRKNCSVNLDLQVPNGWQFSVATFNYRGYLDMTSKVQASHTTTYFFQGQDGQKPENTGRFERVQNGPASGEFVLTDKIGLTSVYIPSTWSPCNVSRALTLNPSISLRKLPGASKTESAVMVNDSIDGEIKQEFGLVWRKCK
ncbi:MAG: DUF4360 domain-containing protein [Proteobacteria bacterium]|nr:MAG: DUF4360 domain-containing protein [Pseudomonadota bacterium]